MRIFNILVIVVAFPAISFSQTGVVSPGEGPHAVYTTEYAVVTLTGSSEVAVIDIESGKVIKSFELKDKASMPTRIAVTPDGLMAILITHTSHVSFLDMESMTCIKTLPLLEGPEQIGVTPVPNEFDDVCVSNDGKFAYITEYNENGQIFVIDMVKMELDSVIPLGDEPQVIVYRYDGSAIYVLEEGSIHILYANGGYAYVYQPIATDEVGHFALTPDDNRAIFVDADAGIYLLDVNTPNWNILDHVLVPGGRFTEANWVAVTPDGAKAIIANGADQSLTFIEVGSNNLNIIETYDVTGIPGTIAITSDGEKAVVTLMNTSFVLIIDVETREVLETIDEGLGLSPFGAVITDTVYPMLWE